ncbi:hypothetical protein EEJ42_40350 [Streptomyces botrytidirepellens]|uniref:Uncharacterized protein n=1 Tax=Streptomyces botrytidirepellens TaxID=2486417 RepID=A0A3M8TDF8_9ACTN|nr:hypothetical protein EEJ42_40350 [Streptomyces botrytidirepellens]
MAADTRVVPGEEGNDASSVRDRWRNHKTTVLTAAGTALVLAGCALAMSTIIDSASVSFGSRQPAGGQVSLTAPPSQGDESAPEETPPADSTAPQPSASSGPSSPSQDDEDDREDSHDDEDDEDDEDDG